jgi:hypothetical protein
MRARTWSGCARASRLAMRPAPTRLPYAARRVGGGSVMLTLRMSSGIPAYCRMVTRAVRHRSHPYPGGAANMPPCGDVGKVLNALIVQVKSAQIPVPDAIRHWSPSKLQTSQSVSAYFSNSERSSLAMRTPTTRIGYGTTVFQILADQPLGNLSDPNQLSAAGRTRPRLATSSSCRMLSSIGL